MSGSRTFDHARGLGFLIPQKGFDQVNADHRNGRGERVDAVIGEPVGVEGDGNQFGGATRCATIGKDEKRATCEEKNRKNDPLLE